MSNIWLVSWELSQSRVDSGRIGGLRELWRTSNVANHHQVRLRLANFLRWCRLCKTCFIICCASAWPWTSTKTHLSCSAVMWLPPTFRHSGPASVTILFLAKLVCNLKLPIYESLTIQKTCIVRQICIVLLIVISMVRFQFQLFHIDSNFAIHGDVTGTNSLFWKNKMESKGVDAGLGWLKLCQPG